MEVVIDLSSFILANIYYILLAGVISFIISVSLIVTIRLPSRAMSLKALCGRFRVPRPIRTIIISHIIVPHIFIGFLLIGIQFPVLLLVPPKIGGETLALSSTATWAAINIETLEVGFERCLRPICLGLASICGPTLPIPQACLYLHWLRWVANPNIFVVLEHSEWDVVHIKPAKFTQYVQGNKFFFFGKKQGNKLLLLKI